MLLTRCSHVYNRCYVKTVLLTFNFFFSFFNFTECPILQSNHRAIPESCRRSVSPVQVSLFYLCVWAWQVDKFLSILKWIVIPISAITDPISLCWKKCWLFRWENFEEFGGQCIVTISCIEIRCTVSNVLINLYLIRCVKYPKNIFFNIFFSTGTTKM